MERMFENTLNTRTILKNNLKYIRSDLPAHISHKEIEWLVENKITTIIDLRTDKERADKVCPLINDSRFEYHCMAVSGGNSVPFSPDEVAKSYVDMVDDSFKKIISLALNSKSNVLYFCNAGKDRTGVVSAVLLYKLGVETDYIVDDYIKSKTNLEEMLTAFAKQNPSVNIDVITPQKRYIKEFLDWFSKQNEI
ncbi:MAG: tyrosine-protein phosphatase [Oscillospiraceae bacterium]|nr:tyrosine-protein phosphatase [Oscillospiraceae bacterium]